MEIVRGKKLKNKLSIIVISIIVGIVLLVMGIISYAKSNEEITTLSILTKNGDSTVNLSGAKYTIKKVTQDKDGKEIEEDAKDFKGNLIGNIENINGTDYRVIESDKNGEINLDLKSGKYRVTEVQAPTGYKLNDNNTYEANLEAKGEYIRTFANKEWEKEFKRMFEDPTVIGEPIEIIDIQETTGEEYIALVEIVGDYTIPTEEMENGKLKELQKGIFIFRYSSDNKISEIVELVGNDTNYLKASSYSMNNGIDIIAETDEYYIIGVADEVLIYFNKSGELEKITAEEYGIPVATQMSIVDENNNITTIGAIEDRTVIPAEKTTNNKEIVLERKEDGYNTILIQFSKDGKVSWATLLGKIEIGTKEIIEKDNKYLTGVYIENNITIEGYNTSSGENIEVEPGSYKLYFNKDGKVEEFKELKNPLLTENNGNFEIPIEILTLDGGEIFQLKNYEQYTISSEWTTEGKDIILEEYESYIIKLNEEDKVEWVIPAYQFDYLFEIDNGYIVTCLLNDEIDANSTVSGQQIEDLNFNYPVEMKINKDGKVMYAKNVDVIDKKMGYIIQDVISLKNNKYVYLKRTDYLRVDSRNFKESSNSIAPREAYNDFTKLEKYKEIEEEREKIDKKIINVTNKQEESLQIIKKDSRTAQLLPGAKFTIKRINENTGNITKEDAVDKDGKLIGNIENIDGKDLRVVTTNEKGEINESLPIGKYEIVEVKAPEGYYLKPTVEENTYEVEITEKQEEKKEWKESWNRIVGSKYILPPARSIKMYHSETKILENNETGVVVYLNLDNIKIPAEDTVNNKEININNPVIIKYNLDNKVEWLKNTISADRIDKMDNGKYKLSGYNDRKEITINAEDTVNNKPIIIKNSRSIDLILNEDFKVESISNCSNINYVKDNIYIIEFYEDTIIPELGNTTGQEISIEKGKYLVQINEQLKIEKIITKLIDYDNIYAIDNESIVYRISPNENTKIKTIDNREINLLAGKEYMIKIKHNGEILSVFGGLEEIKEVKIDGDGYLLKIFNKNNITIPAKDTYIGKDVILKNYMYLKLDNNLKLVNNTIDFWNTTKSFSAYLTLVDIIDDGYLIKVFSTKTNIIHTNELSNQETVINSYDETILKFDKNLKVLEKLNEFYINSYYSSSGEYVTSNIIEQGNGIYNMRRNVGYGGIIIPVEDTVGNEEISINSGSRKILYNNQFKVLGVDMDLPVYITDSGYIFKEYNREDTIIPANKTVNGYDIKLKEGYSYILYNKNIKVERVLTGYNFQDEYKPKIENTLHINNTGETFTIKAEDTENNEEILVDADSEFKVFINPNTLKIRSIMRLPDSYYSEDVSETEDGYIIEGRFFGEKLISGKYTETGKDIEIKPYEDDEYTIKYNKEGKIQYILSGYVESVKEHNDNYVILTKNDVYDLDISRYNLVILDKNWNIKKEIKDFLLETSDEGYIYNKEYKTNTTITKENNTTGEDIFVNKGKYLVKENKKGKIEWLIEEKNKDNVNELVEINNTYFGTFEQDKGNNNYEFGFFKISEKTIKEQLTNKKVINITNESDVGKIVTKYVDKATNKEIAVSEEITDRVGVDYETKAKEIEYYKLEGTPENAKGKVTNGTTEVIYYYNKQDFNIKADKTISELYVNGEKQDVKNNKNNIFHVSINRKEVTKTDLKIRYIIRISNTGEIPGTAGKVTDQIPEGLEFHQEDNPDYWKLENGVAITDKLDNKVILPGQFEELEIILRCSNLEDKLGVKTNHVVAENMNNEPNFEDTNKEDDKGKCDLIVSIGLGGTDIIAILGISTISLIVVAKVINKFRKRSK